MTQAIRTKTEVVEPFKESAEKGTVVPFASPKNKANDPKPNLWETMSPEEYREYQIACQRKAMEESKRSSESSSHDSSREQQQQKTVQDLPKRKPQSIQNDNGGVKGMFSSRYHAKIGPLVI